LKTDDARVVVMADDDDDDCMLAKDAFRKSGASAAFHCVENGIELLDYLSCPGPLPALILLDLNMPRKDGRQALREIKAIPAFRSIPVVVFTTSREEKDIAYSRELGANSFVTKPVTFGEWVEMMRSLAQNWLAPA
jgi:CheY-like chemotaxis protein